MDLSQNTQKTYVLKRNLKEWHTNPETGFLIRRVYGETERFTYHDHDYYEIFLTVSGTIKHYINGKNQSLVPGCLVFIRPSDKHLYVYQNEKNYEFVNVALDPEIIEGMFSYLKNVTDTAEFITSFLPPTARLTVNEVQSFMKKIDSFNAFQQEDIQSKKLKIRTFLLEVFAKHFINNASETKNEVPLWLDITCDKMKKPENFTVGIKRMVELSGKTQEHLARCVKKYFGVTLSEYINDLRLNYAVNLITSTNLKVTDICYEAGFGNISTFYTLFQNKYGVAPKQFRN